MRKHATSWIIKVFFAIIIIVFVFYFGYGRMTPDQNVVAQVGSYKIALKEYEDARKKSYEFYKMLYKDKLDEKMLKELNFEQKILDDLVDSYVLLVEAKKMGFRVGDKEFSDVISSVPSFQKDGKFDKDRYSAALRKVNQTPDQFEESMKKNMLRQKVIALLQDTGAFFSEADVWAGYVKEKGSVDLAYANFDPQAFKGKVAVSEKELNDIYEREKSTYRAEDTYSLKEIVIDEKSGIKDDAVYMDLLKTKDIEAYGKEKGLTVTSIGPEKTSNLIKRMKGINIVERLKGLKKGECTVPVREGGKSYIFQLVDMEAGKDLSKDVAIAQIKEKIVAEKAKVLAKEAAETAIKAKSVKTDRQTGFVSRESAAIPGIGEIPTGNRDLLTLSKSEPLYGKVVEIGGAYYVFSFKEEKMPDKQEWEKEKESYGKYFAAKKKEELVKSFLAKARAQVKIKITKKL